MDSQIMSETETLFGQEQRKVMLEILFDLKCIAQQGPTLNKETYFDILCYLSEGNILKNKNKKNWVFCMIVCQHMNPYSLRSNLHCTLECLCSIHHYLLMWLRPKEWWCDCRNYEVVERGFYECFPRMISKLYEYW